MIGGVEEIIHAQVLATRATQQRQRFGRAQAAQLEDCAQVAAQATRLVIRAARDEHVPSTHAATREQPLISDERGARHIVEDEEPV